MPVASWVRSVWSMTSAARAWRPSSGLSRPRVPAMSRSMRGGTWRGALVRPAATWTAAASWLKVRLSGPPISRIRPRVAGSVMACSTRAATSVTETKLRGLFPWPKTTGRPERAAVWLSRSIQSRSAGRLVRGRGSGPGPAALARPAGPPGQYPAGRCRRRAGSPWAAWLDLPADGRVGVLAIFLDRFEVETGPVCEAVSHAEDHHAAHEVPGAVGPG